MHNELTKNDIRIMEEELEHIRLEIMPEVIEEVKRTRAFGDLSENDEYKTAKRIQNRYRSRMRYLEGMIKTAKVILWHLLLLFSHQVISNSLSWTAACQYALSSSIFWTLI